MLESKQSDALPDWIEESTMYVLGELESAGTIVDFSFSIEDSGFRGWEAARLIVGDQRHLISTRKRFVFERILHRILEETVDERKECPSD